MAELNAVGIVVIGRNEEKHLLSCLQSLPKLPTIYVDSGSTDHSLEIARLQKIPTISLTPDRPFTAARGRNAGAAYLLRNYPEIRFLQFIDGDCELYEEWTERAVSSLTHSEMTAAVYGYLEERVPDHSFYNRLCALEWQGIIGEAPHFPGIVMLKSLAWKATGGYDERVIAGEDSEFSVRLRLAEWKILMLDQKMAIHDAHMFYFSQWLKRSLRAGHATAERYALHGDGLYKECLREVLSTSLWGALWPLFMLLLLPYNAWISLSAFLVYPMLAVKIALFRRRHLHNSFYEATLYAVFCVLSKVPSFIGMFKYALRRFFNTERTIIEYK